MFSMSTATCRRRCRRLLAGACLLVVMDVSADTLVQSCFGCHGPDGVSSAPHMPSIAGLNFRYFYATMQAFRKDLRGATIMNRIAKGYKSGQLQRMALYFGNQTWTGQQGDIDRAVAERGRVLHEEYCEKCHKQAGRFQDKETPPLAGQSIGYLLYQMTDYRTASGGMRQPPLMQERLEKLSDRDLHSLASFYASELAAPPQTTESGRTKPQQ